MFEFLKRNRKNKEESVNTEDYINRMLMSSHEFEEALYDIRYTEEKLQRMVEAVNFPRKLDGQIEIKTGVKDHCAKYDAFGLCSVSDCLTCENSLYQIILSDGSVMYSPGFYDLDKDAECYTIEIFDEVSGDLIKYLNDDKSNYRITRESDGVVLRFSLYDMRKQEYENSRLIRGFKKRP